MFVRIKNSHGYKYLQIVESKREGKKVKQRVLTTLGQLDALSESVKCKGVVSRQDRAEQSVSSSVPPARNASSKGERQTDQHCSYEEYAESFAL